MVTHRSYGQGQRKRPSAQQWWPPLILTDYLGSGRWPLLGHAPKPAAMTPSLPNGGRMSGESESPMCLDCGCGEPNERHGDDRHISMDDIRAAAEASEISVEEATRNI